jgi:hypothetical protein
MAYRPSNPDEQYLNDTTTYRIDKLQRKNEALIEQLNEERVKSRQMEFRFKHETSSIKDNSEVKANLFSEL